MTNEQKQEFLAFLDKECSLTDHLNRCSFRLLCFLQNKHKPTKDYIYCDQTDDQALWESNLIIPSLNIKIPYTSTVQQLVDLLNKS